MSGRTTKRCSAAQLPVRRTRNRASQRTYVSSEVARAWRSARCLFLSLLCLYYSLFCGRTQAVRLTCASPGGKRFYCRSGACHGYLVTLIQSPSYLQVSMVIPFHPIVTFRTPGSTKALFRTSMPLPDTQNRVSGRPARYRMPTMILSAMSFDMNK